MRRRFVLLSVLLITLASVVNAPAVAAATPTWIDLDTVSSPVDYGDRLSIDGQVLYVDPDDGKTYALSDVDVVLEMRYLGTATWRYVATDTATGFWPYFEFAPAARRNTEFRVTFAGTGEYGPSVASATVKVHRVVTSNGTEPREGVFFLSGKVKPSYLGRPVFLQRQKCSGCVWRTIDSERTNSLSRYRFRLPAPRSGSDDFRVMVPADSAFLRSCSSVWTVWTLSM
jgi:hypothetical protein